MVHINSKNLIHCFYSRNPQIDFLKKLLKNKIKKVKNMHITYIWNVPIPKVRITFNC